MDALTIAILKQIGYYFLVMLLGIVVMAMFLKGFIGNYIKARASFGRLVLIKIRGKLRDYFTVGHVEEGFLVYNKKGVKEPLRIAIKGDDFFYRSLSCIWVDMDEEKQALSKTDYNAVSGHDPEKWSNLLKRALEKPMIDSGKEKLIVFGVILAVILGLATAFICFKLMRDITWLRQNLPGMIASAKQTATIVSSNTAI